MATVFKSVEKGTWFKFDDDDPKSGRICLRPLTGEKEKEIRKECTKKSVDYRAGGKFRHEVIDFDDDRYTELMLQYCIVNWEGLEDEAGKPIKCTNRLKYELPMKQPGFSIFITQKISILSRDSMEFAEKEKKT